MADLDSMGQPRRLLHVFSTFKVGGPQMRFAKLAHAQGALFDHAVIAMDGRYEAQTLVAELANVRYPMPELSKGGILGRVVSYLRVLRQSRPDLLVTYNWGAIEWAIAARLCGQPHLHIEDGFGPEEQDHQIPRRVLMRRLFLSWGCRLLVPSRRLEKIALEVWKLPRRKVLYHPNGIALDRFAAAEKSQVRARWGLKKDHFVYGTIAALRREKNLARLLEAFDLVRRDCSESERARLRLVIAGEGEERAGLEALAGDLGLGEAVLFTGYVAEPESLVPAFDVFCLSSDTEQMPVSVLEAMASGLPVVATDVGDLRSMLGEANAACLVARRAPALAEGMAALMEDPARAVAMGQENRVKAQSLFDAEEMFKAYRALFEGRELPEN